MKNFLRRLVRFVNGPRHWAFYSPRPYSPKEFWEAVDARTLAHQISVGTHPKPGIGPYRPTAYRERHPILEWPDFLSNGLFVFFCTWVLWRAFVSPAGLWIVLLASLVASVMLARLLIQLCRMAWRALFSHHKGRCAASPGFRRCAPAAGVTRHPPQGAV